MGFPVVYTEDLIPKLFICGLSLLGLIRSLILSLLRFMGLPEFLEPADASLLENPTRGPETPPISAVLIRELLQVAKLAGEAGESCAVCLYEMEVGDEIRWLRNCRHIFHRSCLERWMDHDQKTCPLCRTPFVPHEKLDEFNQRLWAAPGAADPYSDYYSSVSSL
ncbi:brassinosteroid-responsive RING protein 1-like [Diospyros lotus]|uniref:brassinosteroid-responsive RING protein 1-like n=1 Tax=Diospyros lotus TaxID=55363 RepID=UPI0022542C9F|nr:brassinosteroid-responsive RING protein 1-like [Diospyros lotus]